METKEKPKLITEANYKLVSEPGGLKASFVV